MGIFKMKIFKMNKKGVMDDFADFMFTIVAGIIIFLFLGFALSNQSDSRDVGTKSVLNVNQEVDNYLVKQRLNPPEMTKEFNPAVWVNQRRVEIKNIRDLIGNEEPLGYFKKEMY